MPRRRRHRLIYDDEVIAHLRAIDRKLHSVIRDTIEQQLRQAPSVETRNRKPLLRPSSLSPAWELRLGPQNRVRVFYRVDDRSREVSILAIGEKRGVKLSVGGKEFKL